MRPRACALQAGGINASGQIIGSTDGFPGNVWMWQDGHRTSLPLLSNRYSYPGCGGYGINDSGQAVGYSVWSGGSRHACMWSGGAVTDLGTLGGLESHATDINNAGQIVGSSEDDNGNVRAFFWENGTMTDIGTLGGNRSEAYAVNAKGQVVGQARNAAGADHAFLWENGTMTDLGTMGGSWSRPHDINDLGQIVGESEDAAGVMRAVMWEEGAITKLTNGSRDWCLGINNLGQIVGFTDGSKGAFLIEDGVMHNLKTHTGWDIPDISTATDINDSGQILVHGNRSVYLLTPIPEPATLAVLAFGGLGLLRRRRRRG